MGSVILLIKVFVEDPANFGEAKKGVGLLKPDRLEEEEIGFGVKFMKVTKVVPDASGGQEEFETKLRAVKGVSDIEVVMATRSL